MIRNLEMLVTGRLHASVAGVSECVPTVVMMYGLGPISLNTIGFHSISGTTDYIAYPQKKNDIISKIEYCWNNRQAYREFLKIKIPEVQKKVHLMFDMLLKLSR